MKYNLNCKQYLKAIDNVISKQELFDNALKELIKSKKDINKAFHKLELTELRYTVNDGNPQYISMIENLKSQKEQINEYFRECAEEITNELNK